MSFNIQLLPIQVALKNGLHYRIVSYYHSRMAKLDDAKIPPYKMVIGNLCLQPTKYLVVKKYVYILIRGSVSPINPLFETIFRDELFRCYHLLSNSRYNCIFYFVSYEIPFNCFAGIGIGLSY